jgi:hypothetical protein
LPPQMSFHLEILSTPYMQHVIHHVKIW